MTEPMLLQLLADLRTVFRATSKPITLVSINEQLTKSASAGAIRYTLRIVDILVTTGELTRDINVDGGRCTYLPTGKDNRDTGRAILAAFKFDLEEAAALPAAEKAALAPAESPAPPQPAVQATPVAKSQTKPAAAPAAKPGSKISLRPGSARTRVMTALQEAPRPRSKLLELLPDIGSKALDSTLFTLRSDGLVLRPKASGSAWTISAFGSELLQAIPIGPVPQAKPEPEPVMNVTQHASKSVLAWTEEVREALDKMRAATAEAAKRRAIDDLELKHFTLKSLAEISDPAVARVLECIRDDLKAAA